MRTRAFRTAFLVAVAAGMFSDARGAQRSPNPPLVIDSMTGSDLFQFYCATCHGRDGRGNGPAGSALKTPPADLTLIAKRHGGRFPRASIAAYVTGDAPPMASHGSRDMPLWGPIFRGLDPSDARAKVRTDNLVTFLASIHAR